MIQNPVALDSNGNLVSASEALKHQDYYCICHTCHGRMRLVEGPLVQPHFRHIDPNVNHSSETLLHEYAKHYIAQQIRQSEHFIISYNVEESCCKERCGFDRNYCKLHKFDSWDIKQYGYNTVEIEKDVKTEKGHFTPDVLIASNKFSKDPIFIEVEVTHPCTVEKLQSGYRIIEIKLPEDYNITQHPLGFKRLKEGDIGNGIWIKFHNFTKNRLRESDEPLDKKDIKAIILKNDGKVSYIFNNLECSKYGKKIWRGSKIEVHFAIDYFEKFKVTTLKAVAALYGIPCKNCRFCGQLEYEYGRFNYKIPVCGRTKKMITSGNDAETCQDYSFSERNALKWASRLKDTSYVAVDKNGIIMNPLMYRRELRNGGMLTP